MNYREFKYTNQSEELRNNLTKELGWIKTEALVVNDQSEIAKEAEKLAAAYPGSIVMVTTVNGEIVQAGPLEGL